MSDSPCTSSSPRHRVSGKSPRRTRATNGFGSLLAAALALVVVGAAASANSSHLNPGTITIGLTTPLAASSGGYGVSANAGLQLAIKQINAAGGINGTQIAIDVQDNACTPTGGVTSVQKLLSSNPKPVVILGGLCSGATLAALPIISRAQVPLLVDEASNPQITEEKNPWVFRWVDNDDESATATIQGLAGHHLKKIAIVADNLAYGHGGAAALQAEAKREGITILSTDYVDTTNPDFAPIIAHLQAEKPQAVALWMTTAGTFYDQYGQSGLKKVPLAGQLDLTQKAVTTYNLTGWDTFQYAIGINTPANKKFLAAWKADGQSLPAASLGYDGYEAGEVLAAALKNAKSFSPSDIRDALKAVSFSPTLAGGTIKFDAQGQAHDNIAVVSFTGPKESTTLLTPAQIKAA
jgi:branched-chain amino acid transport system substrate-binding protein